MTDKYGYDYKKDKRFKRMLASLTPLWNYLPPGAAVHACRSKDGIIQFLQHDSVSRPTGWGDPWGGTMGYEPKQAEAVVNTLRWAFPKETFGYFIDAASLDHAVKAKMKAENLGKPTLGKIQYINA